MTRGATGGVDLYRAGYQRAVLDVVLRLGAGGLPAAAAWLRDNLGNLEPGEDYDTAAAGVWLERFRAGADTPE